MSTAIQKPKKKGKPVKGTKAVVRGREFEPNWMGIIPAGVAAPKPVTKAAAAAGKALGEYEEAARRVIELEAEVEAAPRHDERAAAAAVGKGESLPPATHQQKLGLLDDARRVMKARRRLAMDAIQAQADEITDHYDEITAGLQASRDEKRQRADELIDELHELAIELEVDRMVMNSLRDFSGWGGTLTLPTVPQHNRAIRRFEKAQRKAEEMLEARQLYRDDPADLLARIKRLVGVMAS